MPSFVGSAIAHGSDNTSKTPDFSGVGWSVGDLAIASCWRAVNSGYMSPPDSSWALLSSRTDSATSARATRIYYKILESGEDETPTFTLLGSTASAATSVVISIWTGVDDRNPLDVFSSPLTNHLNNATPTPSAVTTLTNSAQVALWHGSYYATSFSGGAPSGYTLRVDYSGATYDDRQQFLADKTITTAGTETPGAWTHSASPGNTEEGQQQTIALRAVQTGDFPQVWERAETTSVATTSHSIAMPGTVLVDDLLVIIAYVTGTAFTVTSPPSGFTRIDSDQLISQSRAWIGWKQASGGEGGGTVGLTTDVNTSLVAQVLRVRGWDMSDVPEIAETTGFSTTSPALSPSWGADTNLYMGLLGNLSQEGSPPSPLNWRGQVVNTGAQANGIATGRFESSASSFTPGTWISLTTGGSVGGWMATLAIRGDVVPTGGGIPGGTIGVGDGWGIPI